MQFIIIKSVVWDYKQLVGNFTIKPLEEIEKVIVLFYHLKALDIFECTKASSIACKYYITDFEADMDIIEEWIDEEKITILSKTGNSTGESECKYQCNNLKH